MPEITGMSECTYRPGYLGEPDWRISRLTELLLKGFSWKSVRNVMLLDKDEFDHLLEAAVTKAQSEQMLVEATYGPVEPRIDGED
jgi:hypothetical protein